jgi:hypothetical protein
MFSVTAALLAAATATLRGNEVVMAAKRASVLVMQARGAVMNDDPTCAESCYASAQVARQAAVAAYHAAEAAAARARRAVFADCAELTQRGDAAGAQRVAAHYGRLESERIAAAESTLRAAEADSLILAGVESYLARRANR